MYYAGAMRMMSLLPLLKFSRYHENAKKYAKISYDIWLSNFFYFVKSPFCKENFTEAVVPNYLSSSIAK